MPSVFDLTYVSAAVTRVLRQVFLAQADAFATIHHVLCYALSKVHHGFLLYLRTRHDFRWTYALHWVRYAFDPTFTSLALAMPLWVG